MKKRLESLYLLYQFRDSNDLSLNLDHSQYNVILLFTEVGEMDVSDCKKVIPGLIDMKDINFRTKEELVEFSKDCLRELDFPQIFLLASKDYNIGIESCHDLSVFREIFDRYGHKITLDPSEQNSKNIFGKLF